jgi:release factor glutamine methyltransferase
MPSIQAVLTSAVNRLQSHTESPLLDAEILLCHVLEKNRSYLRTWPERELTRQQNIAFTDLLRQREQGRPIAYLTGTKEFWSREFMVNPDVLIPRPETELLVDLSLNLIDYDKPCRILDLGTGSGIVAITLAAERPLANIIATDSSPTALAVAQENAKRLQVNNVIFIESNWFDNIPQQPFDLIVSNPPYIAETDPHLNQGDLRFEPRFALVSDDLGLKDIKAIVSFAHQWLSPNAYLMLEHGYNQSAAVQALLHDFSYQNIDSFSDLSGHPRVTRGQNFH